MNIALADRDPQRMLDFYESRAHRFETPCGDGTMVWRVWGDGRPVVLLHGAHGSWAHWVRNIDALAASYALWIPDLTGMGDSCIPVGDDHAALVNVIAEGLRLLLPSDIPLPVVGFSFGGVLSAHLAALHPDVVSRIIVIDPGGLDTPLGDFTLQRIKGLDPEASQAARRANLLAIMLHDPASVDPLALQIQASGLERARFNPASLIMPDHLVAVLPRSTAHVDAIWGEFDRPHPVPAEQEQALRRHRPDLRFRVVEGAGHWCMYERPAAFNAALLELLSDP